MPELNPAIVALNQQSEEFWRVQKQLMEMRLADRAIAAAALETIESEARMQVPVRNRLSLEEALAKAERDRKRFLGQQASKGGTARRPDPLQELVIQIVRRCQSTTTPELLQRLKDHCPAPPIVDIDDGSISFTTRDGRMGEARISGLKDRLARAKKALRAYQ